MLHRQLDPKTRKLREKADRTFAERKWEKALQIYLEVDEIGPEDPRIGQRIADLYRRLGEDGDAISFYKKVVRHYSNEGFWAKAIAVSKMILEMNSEDQQVRNHLVQLYSAQGKTSEEATIRKAEERAALSLASAEPYTMDTPKAEEMMIGNTISLSGEEPRTEEAPPKEPPTIDLRVEDEVTVPEVNLLGPPLDRLCKVPLFSEMQPAELVAVFERMAIRCSPVGTLICEEGDVGDSMYILAEGNVEVSVKEPDGSQLGLARLRGGDFFGEYSLLTQSARNATVTAKTDVELLEITRSDFEEVSRQHPRIWSVLQNYLKKRVLDTIFARSSVFRALSQKERSDLAARISPRPMKLDEVVMEEGTDGDEMFFIKTGQLVVSATQTEERVALGELGPGDYFGEVAMLTGKVRTATVRARTEGELFCLKRKDAAPILRNNKDILKLLRSKMEERAKDTLATLESYHEARMSLV